MEAPDGYNEAYSPWRVVTDDQAFEVIERLRDKPGNQIEWPIGSLVMRGSIDAQQAYDLFEQPAPAQPVKSQVKSQLWGPVRHYPGHRFDVV